MDVKEDYSNYPENPLGGRTKLVYDWIPANSTTLLDGGCAWGYGTRFFKKKCKNTYGIDPNEEFITIARKRYPNINFIVSGLEDTQFESNFFDVIILNDVFEHVKDEIKSLNEMYRILKPGGTFMMTTPHKGLFSFMDPENYKFHLMKNLPRFYKFLYRIKKVQQPKKFKVGYEEKHRHYAIKDFIRLLDSSKFKNHYIITKIFRSGLFIGVFTNNLNFILIFFLGQKSSSKIIKPLTALSKSDYWIPYNRFSYHIALKILKK